MLNIESQLRIVRNDIRFPGVPRDCLIGEWIAEEQESGAKFRLLALGDIGLSGQIGVRADEVGNIEEIFHEISPALHAADLVMANLEIPLLDDWSAERMFAGHSRWAPFLAKAGFDVFHLASNHMLDFGSQGFSQTIKAVRDSKITIIGAGATTAEASGLVVTEIGGLRIGWLAAGHTKVRQPESPRYWELDFGELLSATEQARSQVDLLIISLHYGGMLIDYPYLEQYRMAHKLVDVGASAVLMHHAHILQGVEVYSGAPICYNLGNCILDPTEGLYQKFPDFEYDRYEEQITSCVFSLTWQNKKFKCLHAAPFVLPDPLQNEKRSFGLAWPAEPKSERILARLARISEDLKGDFSKKIAQQIQAHLEREISININLILRHHQYWRIWYLIKQMRWRHIGVLRRMVISILKGDTFKK